MPTLQRSRRAELGEAAAPAPIAVQLRRCALLPPPAIPGTLAAPAAAPAHSLQSHFLASKCTPVCRLAEQAGRMLEALQALSLQAGAFCWSLVLILKWLHSQFIIPTGRVVADTLLPVWEESVKASVGRGCGAQPGMRPAIHTWGRAGMPCKHRPAGPPPLTSPLPDRRATMLPFVVPAGVCARVVRRSQPQLEYPLRVCAVAAERPQLPAHRSTHRRAEAAGMAPLVAAGTG